jgi:hypothetical protein
MSQDQTPQAYFRSILLTVVGQAFDAAGYQLEDRPMKWANGRFRFSRQLGPDDRAIIDFQLLAYVDTMWAPSKPSRFKVTLQRAEHRRDLAALVVEDFAVPILPSADHWWMFATTEDLGKALAEAGHLIIGYGIPWLSGDLKPDAGVGQASDE